MDQILTILFQNQRNDLRFVFKFRKISKKCKEISEYWLTEFLHPPFLINLDITKFKNLRKFKCGEDTTDLELQQLKHLIYLDTNGCLNHNISNEGIKHLNLEYLDIFYNNRITNVGIQHMNLHTLDLRYNGYCRTICKPDSLITDEGIKHMTNLRVLYINGYCGITNEGLKYLNLHTLSVEDQPIITDEGIKHMNLHKLYTDISTITDEGIKHMPLKVLHATGNSLISDAALITMDLEELVADDHCKITIEGIKHMTKCDYYINT